MRAGLLSHTIILQRASDTVSAAGTVTTAWTDFAVVRAERVSNVFAEVARAYGEGNGADLVFRIRHFHGLTHRDRVIFEGEPYNINSIVELGRRRVMELRCGVPN